MFSKKWGRPTLESKKNPKEPLGNDVGFSDKDLEQVIFIKV